MNGTLSKPAAFLSTYTARWMLVGLLILVSLLWLGRRALNVQDDSNTIPIPSDLADLQPQLRAYISQNVDWVKSDPDDPSRLATLGIVYAANELWDLAQRTFERTRELSPDEPLAWMYVGVALEEQGDQPGALDSFRTVTQRFPSFPQGFHRLGRSALRNGGLPEAEEAFTTLTKLAPQEWRGYAGLGEVCLQKNDPDSAVKWLEQAVSIDPTALNARALLGLAYRQTGRLEEAAIELGLGMDTAHYPMPDPWADQAMEHMRLIPQQLEMAEEFAAQGIPQKAVSLLTEALRYDPENRALLLNLCINLNRAGQASSAHPILLQLHRQDTNSIPVHIALSFCDHSRGKLDDALDWANRAVALGPENAKAYLAQANALLALERDEQALEALNNAARCDPKNAGIQIELGDVCLQNLGQTNKAVRHYETARELQPASESARIRLAKMYIEAELLDAAQAEITALRRISPSHPAIVLLELELQQVTGANKEAQ